jgi:hypothetical protein
MVIGLESMDLMKPRDIARLLHIYINTTALHWSNQGILSSYRIGDCSDLRFKREDFERFLCD